MLKRLIIIPFLLVFISYLDTPISCATDAAPEKVVEAEQPQKYHKPKILEGSTEIKQLDTKESKKDTAPQAVVKTSKIESDKTVSEKKPVTIAQSAKGKDEAPVLSDKELEIKRLKGGLKSEKVFERWKSAYESGRNANPIMVDDLITVLHDKDLRVRIEAIESLGKIGDKRAVDYLIPLLEDDKSGIRYVAAKSLIKIGMPSVKPLIGEIERRKYRDRGVIISALKTITGLNYDKPSQWLEWLNTQNAEEIDTEKTVEKTTEKPVEKTDAKATAKPTEKPVEKATAKTTEKPIIKPADKIIAEPAIQKPIEQVKSEMVSEDIDEDLSVEKTTRQKMSGSNKHTSAKQLRNGSASSRYSSAKAAAKKSESEKAILAKSIPPKGEPDKTDYNKSDSGKTDSEKPLPIKTTTAKPASSKSEPSKPSPEKTDSEKPKKTGDKKSNAGKTFEELEDEAGHM